MTEATVTASETGCREAMPLLRPDEDAFAAEWPEELAALWDEDHGWRLTAGYPATRRSSFWEGTEVLPAPDAVAAWVAVQSTTLAVELLFASGRRLALPKGWYPYTWNPPGRTLLVLGAGPELGTW
jgi:Family of unknown function (DUF6292)